MEEKVKGRKPNGEAVAHLRKHPELLALSDEAIARLLINLGFYSRKTYFRDVRVWRLREALKKGALAD